MLRREFSTALSVQTCYSDCCCKRRDFRWMTKDLEFGSARDTDERDATSLGRSYRKGCRCRHRNDDTGTNGRCFLHHLYRNPAGEDHGACTSAPALCLKFRPTSRWIGSARGSGLPASC